MKANRPPVVSARDISSKQRLLVGKGEHGLEQEHHVERAGRDRRDPRDLEATGKVAGALTCDVDGAGAGVHPQIGATQLPSDEPSGPGNAAAEVEHGDPGCDAGLHRQRPDLCGAHEALLLDELARGVRRHAGSLQGLNERSALVLFHGRSTRTQLTIFGLTLSPDRAMNREHRVSRSPHVRHEHGGTVRAVQAGPVTGLIAQVLLLAALAGTVGLSGAGWVVGVTCGVITIAALARGLSRYRSDRLGPADWVTLARATLAVGVAALIADSFDEPAQVTMLVTLAAVALALDAVDGWVARRNGTASTLGARFDGEVDAFLILVLSVYVARSTGAWVLAIGAARYAFLAAGWLLPWMREPLPPRYWRKVVAATQGIVLTIAAADVLPLALTQAALVVALALLAESFGRDVWWLWSHRHATHSRVAAVADRPAAAAHTGPSRGRVRTVSPRCSRSSPFCSCGSPSSLRTSRVVSRPARS